MNYGAVESLSYLSFRAGVSFSGMGQVGSTQDGFPTYKLMQKSKANVLQEGISNP